jgi:hypothetical protein
MNADWDVTADYRGLPAFQCPCGCDLFNIVARFDEETRLPGFYLTAGLCWSCGSLVTVPTPVDEGSECE